MNKRLGPELNKDGIIHCNGCKDWVDHDYYGWICRSGFINIEQYKDETFFYNEQEICPYVKEYIRNKKIDNLLK